MSFGFAAIRTSIGRDNIPGDPLDIELPRLDVAARLGVGRDGDGSFVLVGPGQPAMAPLSGRQFRFDPWTELVDRRSSILLKDVCVLRFWLVDNDSDVRDAVAAVYAGLIELAATTPRALGRAVESMQGLFESGLRTRGARDAEVGLAGELLMIAEAVDPAFLVSTWRTDPQRQFDFSAQGERLDVKTTAGAERVHWFSSGQVAPIPGACTTFMSVRLPIVEVGSTVASIFAGLTALTPTEKARVRSVIIDTMNEPPELLTSVVFDRGASRSLLLHVPSARVPRPMAVPGIRRMRWEAMLEVDAGTVDAQCRFGVAIGL